MAFLGKNVRLTKIFKIISILILSFFALLVMGSRRYPAWSGYLYDEAGHPLPNATITRNTWVRILDPYFQFLSNSYSGYGLFHTIAVQQEDTQTNSEGAYYFKPRFLLGFPLIYSPLEETAFNRGIRHPLVVPIISGPIGEPLDFAPQLWTAGISSERPDSLTKRLGIPSNKFDSASPLSGDLVVDTYIPAVNILANPTEGFYTDEVGINCFQGIYNVFQLQSQLQFLNEIQAAREIYGVIVPLKINLANTRSGGDPKAYKLDILDQDSWPQALIKDGFGIANYPDGKLWIKAKVSKSSQGKWLNDGPWYQFGWDGQLLQERNYENGDMNGALCVFGPNEKVIVKQSFAQGVPVGKFFAYFDDGRIKTTGQYLPTKFPWQKTGVWRSFQSGTNYWEETFDHGIMSKSAFFENDRDGWWRSDYVVLAGRIFSGGNRIFLGKQKPELR